MDHKEEVEELIEAIRKNYQEMQDIVLQSPAELFLHSMHFDSQMTPPPIFEQYAVPYFKDFCGRLIEKGKWLTVHQDADAALLLNLYLEAKIQVVDCFACAPMVTCRFEDAIHTWNKSVVIWGAIPSILLCPMCVSEEELEEHLTTIFDNAEKGRIILAVSDNVMPETDINSLKKITEKVNSYQP